MANGRYIARMDADDIMHPERIAKQVELLESDPTIDVVDTGVVLIDKESNPIGFLDVPGRRLKGLKRVQAALKWGVVFHPSVMARAVWFKKNKYDSSYPRAEDRELFLRCFRQTKIFNIKDNYLFYRIGNESKYNSYLEGYKSERKALLRYGPSLVGWPISGMFYARSLMKTFLIWQAKIRGRRINLQSQHLTKIEVKEYQEVEEFILNIKNKSFNKNK
jgi:glycosyltransferase involved in cell wall biosynthesis